MSYKQKIQIVLEQSGWSMTPVHQQLFNHARDLANHHEQKAKSKGIGMSSRFPAEHLEHVAKSELHDIAASHYRNAMLAFGNNKYHDGMDHLHKGSLAGRKLDQ
jgi:hypothetical protein